MKRLLIIATLLAITASYSEAQLLVDTDRKLKTSKVERRGFLFFRTKKKIKKSDGIPEGDRRRSPRYGGITSPFKPGKITSPRYSGVKDKAKRYAINVRTSKVGGSGVRSRRTGPRFSASNPFRGSSYRVTPRLSRGNPFRGSQYRVSPRYSPSDPYKGADFRRSPRYSPGNPFRGSRYSVSPRYSQGNPFRGSRYRVSPRYSAGNPFSGAKYRVTPRYSKGSPFSAKYYKVSPRYSKGNPFRGVDYKVSPKYSQGMPFRGVDYNVQPRYSKGNPFRGLRYKTSPRYTGGKITFLKQVGNRKLALGKYYQYSSLWVGNFKVKRGFKKRNPSSFASNPDSSSVRKALRKWNIFWAKLNQDGNKRTKKPVKDKVREPKFDKKERVIWNN